MNELVCESAEVSFFKHDEPICGDFHILQKNGDAITAVLSDGMGSGIKANILATLTAKILSTMVMENMPINECVSTMAATLPICEVRKMAYATFTILQMDAQFDVHLVQFDNPFAILLRNGKNLPYEDTLEIICEKEIHKSRFAMQEGDMLILATDGMTNAGVGKTMPEGFRRTDVIEFVEKWYTPDMSPKRMATLLADTCHDLCLGSPDDDVTIMVFKIRERQTVHIMIGPPEHKADDENVFSNFFTERGKHIVCGGSTLQAAARFLGKPVKEGETELFDVPAISYIDGVDLATEGIITLKKVLELADLYISAKPLPWDLPERRDGASLIAKMLFEEATDINIFAGQAINPAHQEVCAGIDFEAKMEYIEKLKEKLTKAEKKVAIKMV